MAQPRRLSAAEDTDLWWLAKLKAWKRAKRLAPDGRLLVKPMKSSPFTPEEIASIFSARDRRPPTKQRLAMRLLHGRRKANWRQRFDSQNSAE